MTAFLYGNLDDSIYTECPNITKLHLERSATDLKPLWTQTRHCANETRRQTHPSRNHTRFNRQMTGVSIDLKTLTWSQPISYSKKILLPRQWNTSRIFNWRSFVMTNSSSSLNTHSEESLENSTDGTKTCNTNEVTQLNLTQSSNLHPLKSIQFPTDRGQDRLQWRSVRHPWSNEHQDAGNFKYRQSMEINKELTS